MVQAILDSQFQPMAKVVTEYRRRVGQSVAAASLPKIG